MARIRNALIIGGGIAGLAASIALRKAGVEVDLVEINRDWTVYHVGIIVQGNAVRAMAALGIADRCVAAGFPCDGVVIQDLEGRVLADIPGMKLAGPRYPSDIGMARPALHEVLIESAQEAGARLRLGVTFERLEQSPQRVRATLTDGSEGEYDLVVGADGIRSKVRTTLFGAEYQPRFTGQGVWRYNVPRPKEVVRTFLLEGIEHGQAGFCPITAETGYVLLVQAEPGNPRHPPEKLAEIFRARLARCRGLMASLRDQITDPSCVAYRPLEVVSLPPPWYHGRVLLIGDAAHATTPHMGQGAAQALEDAVVLGELAGRGMAVEQLLESWMARRYERCRLVQECSLAVGEQQMHPKPDFDQSALTARLLQSLAAPL